MSKKEKHDEHGVIAEGKLNEIKIIKTKRKNGTYRIQQDFTFCPSMAEQHTAHLTDINYLMEKYAPDELAQYIAAKTMYRKEIEGHDFSREPSMQDALNVVYKSRQTFDELPDDLKKNFKSHVEFLKFLDNPDNAERMKKLGILTKQQIADLQNLEPTLPNPPNPKTTQEDEAKKDAKA